MHNPIAKWVNAAPERGYLVIAAGFLAACLIVVGLFWAFGPHG